MKSEKYLEALNEWYFSGYETNEIGEVLWEEKYEDMRKQIKGEGIELGDFGWDISDAFTCVFDNGEVKLTAYISTRGGLYQAGAYDGEIYYGSTNVTLRLPILAERWYPIGSDPIVAQIAKEAWDVATGEKPQESFE